MPSGTACMRAEDGMVRSQGYLNMESESLPSCDMARSSFLLIMYKLWWGSVMEASAFMSASRLQSGTFIPHWPARMRLLHQDYWEEEVQRSWPQDRCIA